MFLIHIYLIVIEFVSVVKLKYVFSLLVKEKKTNKYLKNIIIFIISGCMQTRKPSNYHYYYMYIIDIVFSFTAALKNWTIGQSVPNLWHPESSKKNFAKHSGLVIFLLYIISIYYQEEFVMGCMQDKVLVNRLSSNSNVQKDA